MTVEEKKEYQHQYYIKNRERKLKEAKEYRDTHKEEIAAIKKDWVARNRAHVNKKNKKYALEHPDKRQMWLDKYNQSSKAKYTRLASGYRSMDRMRFGTDEYTITKEQIKQLIESTAKCSFCGCTDINVLGLDRIDNSKPHTIDNVHVCCWHCNITRQDKTYDEYMAQFN